ncbi:MAG: peptidylprolyl isomerase [Flavobacteriales bacterium]
MNGPRFFFPFFILVFCPLQNLLAQENGKETILKVGDEKISKNEFKTIYFKNNQDSVVTKKALEDYMDLFIDFKLKVKEAERMGMDTTQKFKKEFERYKSQLAKPYLIDSTTKRKLLKEAYRRTKTQVHASHILVRFGSKNTYKIGEKPVIEDSTAVMQKVRKIEEQVRNSDSSFLEVGKRIAKKHPKVQASDLGYFDAFRMVYPFEEAAYNTEVGSISDPVRTQYGYHLIKVHDKRASQGRLRVAHIMKHAPKKASAEKRRRAKEEIEKLYQKLQKGADFHKLARKHSDDRKTSRKGGRLPWFNYGDMLPSFSEAAFSLDSSGAVSEPVRTRYGWHIIKRLDMKPLRSFEEMKNDLEKELKKSDRFHKVKDAVTNRLREDYGLKIERGRVEDFMAIIPDSGAFVPDDRLSEAEGLASKTLFSFADTSYPVKELAYHIGKTRELPDGKKARKKWIDGQLDALIDKRIIEYEKGQLKEKHPRYKALLQEYRDGILLFDLMEKKVWQKALEDTIGLRQFFEENKSKYRWKERLDLTYYSCKSKEAAQKVKGMLEKGKDQKKILKALRKGKTLPCRMDSGRFEKKDRAFLEKIWGEKGVTELVRSKGKFFVGKVHEVVPPQPKSLKEARGLISSDYQDHLEKQWVKKLRDKYRIEVDKELLHSIAENGAKEK